MRVQLAALSPSPMPPPGRRYRKRNRSQRPLFNPNTLGSKQAFDRLGFEESQDLVTAGRDDNAPGGIDIDPSRYGAARHPATDPAQERRDAGELRLLESALDRDLPTLAICRGFQLLNVLRGGDLIQHLPERVGHEGHRETMGVFSEHAVDVREGTRLESILGRRHGGVQSSHHQGVGRVGDGLVESAYAEDGSLEAFEDPSKQFALGVLWHTEMEEDKRLFEALVAEARQFRSARRDPAIPSAQG